MKDQTYTINRYVEITQIKAGNYEVRCQDHTWYARTKKEAEGIKRAIHGHRVGDEWPYPTHYQDGSEPSEQQKKDQDFAAMREIQWDSFTSNESGSFSQVHITVDGVTTLCGKKIPQIKGGINPVDGLTPRKDNRISGWHSSATGGTSYRTWVDVSATHRGLWEATHEHSGTCKCCAKRSSGKFIKNHRSNTSENYEKREALKNK